MPSPDCTGSSGSGHGLEQTSQENVELLAQSFSRDDVYPRPDLANITHYLQSQTTANPGFCASPLGGRNSGGGGASGLDDDNEPFAIIYDIEAKAHTPFGSSPAALASFLAHDIGQRACILFLRGWASPEWLNAVGNKFSISPELYRRHLQDNMLPRPAARDLFLGPSLLPSATARVFQLTIPTICARNVSCESCEPEDLQVDRQLEAEAMGAYFKQFRVRARTADSMVRKCLLFSRQHYVIEQTVTIEVNPHGANLRAVVWLDSGRDLSECIEGPWSPRQGTRAWETYFYPVIVTRPGEQPQRESPLSSSNSFLTRGRTRTRGDLKRWRAAQNISLLPMHYGSQLKKEGGSGQVLHALGELFQFAASAEVQFLNFLCRRVEYELSFVGSEGMTWFHQISLLNLKYIKAQLTHHVQSLTNSVEILRKPGPADRLQISQDDSSRTDDPSNINKLHHEENAAGELLADFDFLLQQANSLIRECENGMLTLANSAMLEESRRSTKTARSMQHLSIIATVFIPLSFVCSIWGMNFREMGSGSQPLWWWFVSAMPVLFITLVVYQWKVLVKFSGRATRRLTHGGRPQFDRSG
ncbi:hypothetical protein SAMD00023353_3701000 [Rosellinia necatrix]|uniref:Uncharacterized protein n=1 Tax=Rosellinia necatrix TaxID=77044 RepID=A0A1W2TM13_ROSNE|nr:hypothetical protein SAMD00023353_3701000 [Rosellinia necatrix]